MDDKPTGEEQVRICYTADIQGYLLDNCPLPWVQERLKDNIDIQRGLFGMAHHEW